MPCRLTGIRRCLRHSQAGARGTGRGSAAQPDSEQGGGFHSSPVRGLEETFSPLAQISQQSEEFDFPNPSKPESHRLLLRASSEAVHFPFELPGDKPVLYASLGTVMGRARSIERSRTLANVCRSSWSLRSAARKKLQSARNWRAIRSWCAALRNRRFCNDWR
jgi:hypothetical protein